MKGEEIDIAFQVGRALSVIKSRTGTYIRKEVEI
jgi:hypothetical protein